MNGVVQDVMYTYSVIPFYPLHVKSRWWVLLLYVPMVPISGSSKFPGSRPQSIGVFSGASMGSCIPVHFSGQSGATQAMPFIRQLVEGTEGDFSSMGVVIGDIF